MLLASLSCWIIFTLPLGFIQPPTTSCMVLRNGSVYLAVFNPQQRIVKRSVNLDEFYHRNDDECLEVAENVVFERLRKDNVDDGLESARRSRSRKNRDGSMDNVAENVKDNNRFRRETPTTEESPVEDLKYKQLVFEDNTNNPEAKTIDFETLQRRNRPADVLEYKRFLNVSSLVRSRSVFSFPFKNFDRSHSRINPWTTESRRRRRTRGPSPE